MKNPTLGNTPSLRNKSAGTDPPVGDRSTPEILYRYRNLVGDNREWTARLIRDSVLYFASPASFNDPFDCKVHYSSAGSFSQRVRKQQALYRKFMPGLGRAERRRRAAKDMKRISEADLLRQMTEGLQAAVNGVGVLCFSDYRDDVLLWSHYAASHTGCVSGFALPRMRLSSLQRSPSAIRRTTLRSTC